MKAEPMPELTYRLRLGLWAMLAKWRKFEKRISRLDHCGYEIVQKPHAEASLVPSASDDEVVPHVEHSH
jgi:hypothetical protein